MDTYLLVDGSNLLFQMFYGMPARISGPDGRPIQGTLGFLGALLKMIRMIGPSHVGVFFDGEHENPRQALDEEYKANRPDWSGVPEEELPFSQLPDIRAALNDLGLRHAETVCCETDDWIASYVRRLPQSRVVIGSFDSDYFQLLSDRVSVLRYRGKESILWTPEALERRLGVTPERYPFYKAMTGDASDNIPGIPGVGPKTAAALAGRFSGPEALLEGLETVSRPSVRRAVAENLPRLKKSLDLIRLEGREPLPIEPQALAWEDPGLSSVQVLRHLGIYGS